jgi:hypothetical protein
MRAFTVLALIVTALCVASCGNSGSSSTPTAPSPSASPGTTTATIVINRQNGSLSFSPNPAAFGGQTIDTGDIAPGATSRAVQMPASGTNYHCALHPEMVGAVMGSGGLPAPPCEGVYCATDR